MGLIIQLLVLPPSDWQADAHGSDYPASVSSFSVRVVACMPATFPFPSLPLITWGAPSLVLGLHVLAMCKGG